MSPFNVELKLPRYVVMGDFAVLQCEYNVSMEQLHRVEWLKNGKKIFQFVQGRTPPFRSFAIHGAELDVSSNDIICLFVCLAHVRKSIVRCHKWTKPEKYVVFH